MGSSRKAESAQEYVFRMGWGRKECYHWQRSPQSKRNGSAPLGAACHAGAGVQGTRDGVKEAQREGWQRAYHKGLSFTLGHLDPSLCAFLSHKKVISGSPRKENASENMAASHGSV